MCLGILFTPTFIFSQTYQTDQSSTLEHDSNHLFLTENMYMCICIGREPRFCLQALVHDMLYSLVKFNRKVLFFSTKGRAQESVWELWNVTFITFCPPGHIKPEKLLFCPKCIFVTEYKHHLEYHLRNHYGMYLSDHPFL
jgi:hypothetical protein